MLSRCKREKPSDTLPDLYQMFTSLDEKYRLPLVLYYVEGYSMEETTRMLRMQPGTLKSRLYRGRLLLKNTLNMEEACI